MRDNTGKNPIILFIDEMLDLSEKLKYLKTYWYILRSPKKSILECYENESLKYAARFLILSIGFYFIFVVTQILVTTKDDLITEGLYSIYFIICLSIGTILFYYIIRGENVRNRTFKEHFKICCFLYGFLTPIMGLLQFFQFKIDWELGSVLTLIALLPVYKIFLWTLSEFWQTKKRKVLLAAMVSSTVSGLIGILFLLATGLAPTLADPRIITDAPSSHANYTWKESSLGTPAIYFLAPETPRLLESEVPYNLQGVFEKYKVIQSLSSDEKIIMFVNFIDVYKVEGNLQTVSDGFKLEIVNDPRIQNVYFEQDRDFFLEGIAAKKQTGSCKINGTPARFVNYVYMHHDKLWRVLALVEDNSDATEILNLIGNSLHF